MQKVIWYLTIALVGVGLMVLISEYAIPPEEKFFADEASFNKELKAEIEAEDVPPLPPCAQTIELTRTEEGRVDAIDFICTSEADRTAFDALIFTDYAWEVGKVEEGADVERVHVERLIPTP